MTKTPKGYVAILTKANGSEVATATDFNQFCPGGFKLKNIQETRVKDALARAMIEQTCATYMADVIDTYTARKIMDNLIDVHNFVATYVSVGHDEDE